MPVEMIGWIAPRVSSEMIPPSGPPFDAERGRRDGAHSRAGRLRPGADRLFLGCARRVSGRGARRLGDRAARFSAGAPAGVRCAAARRPQAGDARPAERRPSGGAHHRRRQRRRSGQGRRLDRPRRPLSPRRRVYLRCCAGPGPSRSRSTTRASSTGPAGPGRKSAAGRCRTSRSTAAAARMRRSGHWRRMSMSTCCGANR